MNKVNIKPPLVLLIISEQSKIKNKIIILKQYPCSKLSTVFFYEYVNQPVFNGL